MFPFGVAVYFFKYQSVNLPSLMMLKRGEIYFASPEELNDSNECRASYYFQGSSEPWDRLCHWFLTEIYIRSSNIEVKDFVSELAWSENSLYKIIKPSVLNRHVSIDKLNEIILAGIEELLSNADVESAVGESVLSYANTVLSSLSELSKLTPKYLSSFSRSSKNPTMWGHYANADKGFVIIYETHDEHVEVKSSFNYLYGSREVKKDFGSLGEMEITEIGMYDNERLKLEDVQYRKRPVKLNGIKCLIKKFHYSEQEDQYDYHVTLESQTKAMEEDLLGLVKFTDWKYEKELRLTFPSFDEIPSDSRCLRVSKKHIKGVIFGEKMSNADKEKIVRSCAHLKMESLKKNDKSFSMAFFQSIKNNESFKMDALPIGILSDKYYPQSKVLSLPITRFNKCSESQKEELLSMTALLC
jgi:hypothetical protein